MENTYISEVPRNENSSEPVETGAHLFEPWLTVPEAVAYCLSKGLARTPKTVRKWAQRAVESPTGTGEIVVQRQDTENGFRWLISRDSLDVKIEQEKEFELRNEGEDANTSAPVHTGSYPSEQVATGANMFTPVPVKDKALEHVRTHENMSEPLRSVESGELVGFLKKQLERAEHQLDVKDKQIDALLERDRETNILIQGLQTSLSGVVNALPSARRMDERNSANFG